MIFQCTSKTHHVRLDFLLIIIRPAHGLRVIISTDDHDPVQVFGDGQIRANPIGLTERQHLCGHSLRKQKIAKSSFLPDRGKSVVEVTDAEIRFMLGIAMLRLQNGYAISGITNAR